MNQVTFVGRLARDVEVKGEDVKYIRNAIAVRRSFPNKNGEYDADFIPFVVWGNLANNVMGNLSKGEMVAIGGQMQSGRYEKDGEEHYTLECRVDRITLIDSKKYNRGPKAQDNYQVSQDEMEIPNERLEDAVAKQYAD